MKKLIGLLIALFLLCAVSLALADAALDAAHFPDAVFRAYLSDFDNSPKDGILSTEELLAVTGIDCSDRDIRDMTGLQYFTNLKSLICIHDKISVLDISKNTELIELICWDNQIPAFDFSSNTKLRKLNIHKNPASSVDVSMLPDLMYLSVSSMPISSLNLKNNPKLENLYINYTTLPSLDLTAQRRLAALWAIDVRLPRLDITPCPKLVALTRGNLGDYNENNLIWGNKDNYCLIIPKSQNIITGGGGNSGGNVDPGAEEAIRLGEEKEYIHRYVLDYDDPYLTNGTRFESSNPNVARITEVGQYGPFPNGDGHTKYDLSIKVKGFSTGAALVRVYPANGSKVIWELFVIVYDETQYYTVTVTDDGNGTAYSQPSFGSPGTKVTLTASPNDGFKFKSWVVVSGGVSVSGNEFTIGTSDVVIKATFKSSSGADPDPDPGPGTDSATVSGLAYQLNNDGKTAVFTGPKDKNAASLTIPASIKANGSTYKVTEIAANACKGMKKLAKVSIGNNIRIIGKGAFNGCKALKAVSGGKGVTDIRDSAFQNCSALASFTINSKVAKIGAKAFSKCKKLAKITVRSKLLTEGGLGKNAFKGISSKAVFKCPKGKAAIYKQFFVKKGGAPKKSVFQ